MVCIPSLISFANGLWLISYPGSTLASTGDSGKVYMWRENIGGNFVEFAETEAA